ncbi:MAG: hypothetical protein ABR95_03380 [Sphingobacteriales bacterium BACL12 MAG-120813-bin55]|jgi:hypothetical protein|nr:MAG: hypothetical protein ABR94_00650 [Sphingobacteriales bacterium BACL12 MAG-120802-bin5]KRP08728.1 MAG: hypothetical protein ABR95_03380 [Sphingobacteriales bacterium BACL12 MAG-120813-bin55]
MDFNHINYLAVLVAGVASFALGAIWYSPVMFAKRWQNELGFTDEYLRQANMPLVMGGSLVMMIIMALGNAILQQAIYGADGNLELGLKTGLMIGLFFSATTLAINYFYQRKSLMLWLIDALYQVFFCAIAGAIIGAWG